MSILHSEPTQMTALLLEGDLSALSLQLICGAFQVTLCPEGTGSNVMIYFLKYSGISCLAVPEDESHSPLFFL